MANFVVTEKSKTQEKTRQLLTNPEKKLQPTDPPIINDGGCTRYIMRVSRCAEGRKNCPGAFVRRSPLFARSTKQTQPP